MYKRNEADDENIKLNPNMKKKWVRYKEGALLYSRGINSFMELAKEAKAVYRIRRMVLVNTEKLDEYIELMYGEGDSDY